MEAALGRLYDRLGRRYVVACMAGGSLLTILILGLPGLGCLVLLVPMSAVRFLTLFAVQLGLGALVLWWLLHRTAPERAMLDRWLEQGRPVESAEATWEAIAIVPVKYSKNVLVAMAPLALAGSAFAGWQLDLSIGETGAVALGAALITIATAMLSLFWGELLLRPALRDVAGSLSSNFSLSSTGVPLRRKMLVVLMIIGFGGGAGVAGISAGTEASLGAFTRDVLIALGVSATLVLGFTLLVAESLMAPINELLAATRRIAAGDLSARAPVFSDDEFGALTSSFNKMMNGLVERQRLHEAFGTYVSPYAAKRILEEGSLLAGDEVEVTALFMDVRDFTSFAESASAPEVVSKLNEFFDLVVPVIGTHGGHVNKIVGDGLLAVFGTPEPLPDHAASALAAARELADRVADWDGGLQAGIGVSSGPVVAGTIGGGDKLDFTVIGDPVNVAARIEALTRKTGDAVLVTEATRAALGSEDGFRLEPRGTVEVKGKSRPVQVYALAGA